MPGKVDLGVFLPITNNGWIISNSSPKFQPTYALNLEISAFAEKIGFDYVFAMGKWRGFGGATDFWKHQIESSVLVSALAGAVLWAHRRRYPRRIPGAGVGRGHPAERRRRASWRRWCRGRWWGWRGRWPGWAPSLN